VVELARLLAPYAGPNAAPSLERIAILGPALVEAAPEPQPSAPSFVTGGKKDWKAPPAASAREQRAKADRSTASVLLWALVVTVVVGSLAIVGAKVFASRLPMASRRAPPPAASPSPVPAPVLAEPLPPSLSLAPTEEPAPSPSAKPPISPSGRPVSHTASSGHAKSRPPAPTPPVKPAPTVPPAPTSDIPSSRE
jgi:hypothetical protein